MKTIEKVHELVMKICKEAILEALEAEDLDDYQLEKWLNESVGYRNLAEYINSSNGEFGMNMKVRDLKVILNRIDDEDMDVIIPVLDPDDKYRIHGFRHVRTAGILTDFTEPAPALCLSAPDGGMDMYSQLGYNHSTDKSIRCQKCLF